MPTLRIEKVNELLRQEIALLFVRELEFPKNCLVTVTRVKTDDDLKNAKCFLSIFPFVEGKNILPLIKKRRPFLQQLLNHKLNMKFVPHIHYTIDTETEELDNLERLIDAAIKN